LRIEYLESVDSTQTYLKKLLQEKKIQTPYAVVSKVQTNGRGSRDNSWIGLEGNLFLSFTLSLKDLPEDMKLESASIYFAYILKETLQEFGSQVWLKWPNDFYINNFKIGGMITNIIAENLVCGVGINVIANPDGFEKLDINISIEKLLNLYFKNIEKRSQWKQIFSKYKLEFQRSQNFSTHKNGLKFSLGNAVLNDDGSIVVNGERIYSSR